MIRFHSIIWLVAACLLVAGCKDARRDVAQAYLQARPPEGFAVVSLPKTIPFTGTADGGSEAIVAVRYRLLHPTIEKHDGFTLPRGRAVASRLAAIRGWALSSLPSNSPERSAILAAVNDTRAAFPVKSVVTPGGTEEDAIVTLALRKFGTGWEVTDSKIVGSIPGSPDTDPGIPLQDSPEVAARFDRLESVARRLEDLRQQYLAEHRRAAEQSLANLRAQLRTGHTFEGRLSDRTPVRIVITRGLDAAQPAVAVVTASGDEQSSARYTGRLVQQPSGDYSWRATQVATLSTPLDGVLPTATDEKLHPILTLVPAGKDLVGKVEIEGKAPVSLQIRPGAPVDLIPDADAQ